MKRSPRAMVGAKILLHLLVAISRLPGQDATFVPFDFGEAIEIASPIYWDTPEIVTHSGSPLLLELEIPDPEGRLTAVSVESAASYATYRIEPNPDGQVVHLTLSPFLAPGIYDLRIAQTVDVGAETVQVESKARVGFVDFVFGRDNLRFGNNLDYESVVGTFGEILAEWLNERFEGVGDVALVPLVDYMYGFFGRRGGRCYAFAGSEARFWRWPELLPRYFDETYDFQPTAQRTQRDMNFLQLDMAFDHFLTGTYDLSIAPTDTQAGDQHAAIVDQVMSALSQIGEGHPVVVGMVGTQFHHAMLVYGFVHRPEAGIMDLLVANNWKSDEDLNLKSRDAEAIRVFLNEDHVGPILEWRYSGGIRDYEIDRLFVVDVKREYEHDRRHLDGLVDVRLNQLVEGRRGIFVVEGAAGAWLTNGESVTGYQNSRTKEEIPDVVFDKVDRTYRFEYPADGEYWLELDDDLGSRILHFLPGEERGLETAWIEETTAPEDGEAVRIRVSSGMDEPHWALVAEE